MVPCQDDLKAECARRSIASPGGGLPLGDCGAIACRAAGDRAAARPWGALIPRGGSVGAVCP